MRVLVLGERERSTHDQVALPAQLGDRSRRHVLGERLPVPAFAIFDLREPPALDGSREDHRRPLVRLGRLGKRIVERREIVPVDLEHARAKGVRAACVGAQIPAQFGRPALTEPVDVDDRNEVRQLIVARFVQRLPHRAFRHLAVAAQHPHSKRQAVEVLAGQRDPHPVGQSLPERSGRDVDPRQHRGRVALQTGPEAPVTAHQLLVGHDPDGPVDRVEQR